MSNEFSQFAAGGAFPQSGCWPDDVFSQSLGIEPKTFRKNVREYGIPYRQFGDRMLVDVADLVAGLPLFSGVEDEQPKRKGTRKRLPKS